MRGEKFTQVKEAIHQSLRYLQEGDLISLVVFSDKVRILLEPSAFNDEVKRQVESILQEIHVGGMTALDGGLKIGIEKASQESPGNNLVLLLSDGRANVGETDLERVGQRGSQAREQGMVVSTLGVGKDYNEALMAEIASQGGGRFYHLHDASQIPIYLTGELGEAASICSRETKLEFTLPPGSALIPLSAAYPAEHVDGKVIVAIGSIPLDLELEIPLRLTIYAQPEGSRLSVEGKVIYQSPAGNLLTSILNRVTVRFIAEDKFIHRQGVAVPVVERVLHHRQAAYVLGHSRAMIKDPSEARIQAQQDVRDLREYASLVSEQEAEKMAQALRADYDAMAASPIQSKDRVSRAHGFIRSAKRYDEESN
jgi:Ca-activated chloride channel family protein